MIGGRGDWASWQGRARADAGRRRGSPTSPSPARDGTFTVAGPLRPGLILTGPAQRLAEPLVQLNLVATLDQRRADIRLAPEQPRRRARRRRAGRSRPEPLPGPARRRPPDRARRDRARPSRPRRPARDDPQRRRSRRPASPIELRAASLTFGGDDDRGAARGRQRPGPRRGHHRPGLGAREPHPRLRRGRRRHDRQRHA